MGKARDLFKKIRDTKGTFHAKMGTIKAINGRDLKEAEDIKKRWQEYTEIPYKKDHNDPGNHDGVIPHLEPDILKCPSMVGQKMLMKYLPNSGRIPTMWADCEMISCHNDSQGCHSHQLF